MPAPQKNTGKIKVLYVVGTLSGGGAERVLIELCNHFDTSCFEVRLAVQKAQGAYFNAIDPNLLLVDSFETFRLSQQKKIKNASSFFSSLSKRLLLFFSGLKRKQKRQRAEHTIHKLSTTHQLPKEALSFFSTGMFLFLEEIIPQWKPDIVVTSLPVTGGTFAYWAYRQQPNFHSSKWVVMEHNNTLSYADGHYTNPDENTHFKKLISLTYQEANQITPCSIGVGEGLVQNFRIKPTQITPIPNGVEIESISNLKNTLPSPHPKKYLLAVGRLDKQKRFDFLIDAYQKIVTEDFPDLIILGEGPERKPLEKLIYDHDLKEKILLPGFVDTPQAYLAHSLFQVVSSDYEGHPKTILEAMLHKKAVISFDCKYGPSEIIDHNLTGILVPPGDTSLLAQEMKRLAESPILANEMGIAGHKKMIQRTSKDVTKDFEKLYHELLSASQINK